MRLKNIQYGIAFRTETDVQGAVKGENNMNPRTRRTGLMFLGALVVVVGLSFATMRAQVQSQTTTTSHPATVDTTVERGEVVYVEGNELIVKMEDGSLEDFANIPESAKVIVDGRSIGIRDVKVGMKLEKTITTTTTPKTITTVQTVTGKLFHVSPPNSLILTMEDGTNQQFTIPKDQKFSVDGQMVDAWGLKKGMNISATKVVEVPEVHVTKEHQITGSMPPPPPLPPPDQPILVAVLVPHVPATPGKPAELPKTASVFPIVGLLGLVCIAISLSLRAARGTNES